MTLGAEDNVRIVVDEGAAEGKSVAIGIDGFVGGTNVLIICVY